MIGSDLNKSKTTESAERLANLWKDKWLTPILDAMYSKKLELARDSAGIARHALHDGGLAPDQIEALDYEIRFLELAIHWQLHPEDWTLESYQKALEYYDKPADSVRGESERIRRRFIIQTHADKDGIEDLQEITIDELLAKLPPDAVDSTLWHYIAGWAYKHRNLTLIERAFEALLTIPSEVMGQAKWQRVNLMYQIMTGKVSRRDVAETIQLLTILPQVQEFTNELWPECVKAGVVDEKLEEMFAKKTAEVGLKAGEHRRERKTKSIRNHF